jgi:hypothetical protein
VSWLFLSLRWVRRELVLKRRVDSIVELIAEMKSDPPRAWAKLAHNRPLFWYFLLVFRIWTFFATLARAVRHVVRGGKS